MSTVSERRLTAPVTKERSRAMPKLGAKATRALATLVFGVFLLVLWEIVGRSTDPILLSYPTAVGQRAIDMISDGTLLDAFASSLQPFVLGYALAVVVGIPLGLLIGRYRLVEAAVGAYVTAGYSTPLVALTPLFIVWFGIGFTVKVAIIFALTVFPIIINTWRGVHAVPKTLTEVGHTFGASQSMIMRKIIVPGTLPHIMTGLRLGVGRAVIAVVIAEFFTAVGGLGGIIINAGNTFDTATMWVPILAILLWGVILTAVVGYLERKLAPWHAAMGGRS